MYQWDPVPHLGPTAGIGKGLDFELYQFNSEEEYRAWYYSRLLEWLKWA